MTSLRFSERSRAGLLVVAIGLIGGTGCITAAVVGSGIQLGQERQRTAAALKRENDALLRAAKDGDIDAMTTLAFFQVTGQNAGIPRDPPAGLAVLEQLVAREHAGAEYALGNVLWRGNSKVARDPQRGLALLKRAAVHACKVKASDGYRTSAAVAVSNAVGEGATPSDRAQAELWLARDAVHCHAISSFPSAAGGAPETASQRQITQLAYYTLASSPLAAQFQRRLTAEQIAAAASQAEHLRQRVRDSEAEYPAPPPPTKTP